MNAVVDKVRCEICGDECDVIPSHLKEKHAAITREEYQKQFPSAPLLSVKGREMLEQRRRERADAGVLAMAGTGASNVVQMPLKGAIVKRAMHEVFGLAPTKDVMSVSKGQPIMISTVATHDQQDMVPPISNDYVYNADELKNVVIAMELNLPAYAWGHKGSGKTELFEQLGARTNRPLIRVQHTLNTEQSHIVGQYVVHAGATKFQLGPLPLAMLNGWVYLADEYDRAMPTVLSVYQAVLEGKSLVIMEAPPEHRIIKPHPMFRFCATGNTNGSGDEHGLYPGAMIQDSANYDRFGMVIHKEYMSAPAEIEILKRRCKLEQDDAERLVEFATKVREAFAANRLSDTISPRTLINASRVGVTRASFRTGLQLTFINKLSRIDREVADGLAQRIFG